MKKIVLGCAAVLLSLGLLAGCNNDTDSAVTISVDNTATVVVGETLELPYIVEPEKAKVEVLNDHEEYVTASAKDGVLSLEGVSAGSATITLVGTYKKYTEANVDIKVSVVAEGDVDQEPGPETGGDGGDNNPGTEGSTIVKLGAADYSNEVYRYLDTSSDSAGATVTSWNDASDIYLTEVEGGVTFSFYSTEEAETLNYIAYSGSGTSIKYQEEEYVWAIDESAGAFVDSATGNSGRFLGVHKGYQTLGAFAASNLPSSIYSEYYIAEVWETEPEQLPTYSEPDASGLEKVTGGLTSGQEYYLSYTGEDSSTYYFKGTNYNNNYLYGSTSFGEAVVVKATGDNTNGWALTFTVKDVEYTIYGWINGSYAELGMIESSSLASEEHLFFWDSTYCGVTMTLSSTKYGMIKHHSNSGTTYNNEFGLYSYDSYAATYVWVNFYTLSD